MTRYFLLVLLLAGCAMPAGPRTVLMKDGFLVIVVADTASADKVCDRLSGGFTLPSGGCYVADRDIGDGASERSIGISFEAAFGLGSFDRLQIRAGNGDLHRGSGRLRPSPRSQNHASERNA